jgi:predicted transcriptional regulator
MIDPVKAAAAMELGDLGYPSTQIAPIVGLNDRSIRDIINRHGRWGELADTPVFAKLRREQNQNLESAYRAAAAESLALAFNPDKLIKASYYQLVIGSSIALDKARLLAGESTENVIVVHRHEASVLDRLAERLGQRLLANNVSRETIEVKPEQDQEVKT